MAEFKQMADGPVLSSFYYHHARLVEILHGIEKIEMILTDPQILDKHVRATAGVNGWKVRDKPKRRVERCITTTRWTRTDRSRGPIL